MASKYFTEDDLAWVIREAASGDGSAVPALGRAVDSAFLSFLQELAWRDSPGRIRRSSSAGSRGRPRKQTGAPPSRAPEDWFVQELAMGAMEQLHRVPGSSHPLRAGKVSGPTVRLIVAVACRLAEKLELGAIRCETADLNQKATDRLRALSPSRVRYRLRKARWSGAKDRLIRAVPLAPPD
jgi:hypothetical protein